MKNPRELIFVCTGSDCKKAGSKKLINELKDELNTPERKGNYKLIKTRCLDMCKTAPNAIMNNCFYKKVTLKILLEELKTP